MEKIGLIAGNRRFPLLFSRQAAKKGIPVVAACFRGETDPVIQRIVERAEWFDLGDFNSIHGFFIKEGVSRVAMAGQISPRRLFSREVRENPSIRELLDSVKDKRANTIFGEIARRLQQEGLTLIDSTTFLEDFLPAPGTLTRRAPSDEDIANARFAFSMAKAVAGLDIGLSVAVKSMAVVAVEALEGTDNLILRAGRMAGPGIVVAKAGRPGQDMRFDIPVVGAGTITALARARGACLAFEAHKTLFIDMEQSLRLADKKGISVIALEQKP